MFAESKAKQIQKKKFRVERGMKMCVHSNIIAAFKNRHAKHHRIKVTTYS